MASTTTLPMRNRVEEYIRSLQEQIVTSFESLDPASKPFRRDAWTRAQGGGEGKSCVFQSGTGDDKGTSILEKGGVNISIVKGILPPPAIKQMRADHSNIPVPEEGSSGLPYFAGGISLVIHPRNPNAPTVHANYRYFEITELPDPQSSDPPKVITWWFGGGCDLTPSYLYEEDAIHFHSTIKKACDAHGSQIYPAFKKWCDEYFYLPHRKETRGVGGIFYDDLGDGPHPRLPHVEGQSSSPLRPTNAEDIFAMMKSLGDAFIPSYFPILEKRHSMPFTPLQRRWQLVRRGRYVEFNLVYDRGTKFGLNVPTARVESILMTLPETARWEYECELGADWEGEGEISEEGKLLRVLNKPKEWL